jgi:Holliday junction resolvasome RuvABC endonuclease subunit
MTVVGIDLGIHKIALAVLDSPEKYLGNIVRSFTTEEVHRDEQLAELAHLAHDVCLSQDADYVFIEDTLVGNNRKYSIQLSQTMGAVLCDLAQLRYGCGTQIHLVENHKWKKAVIGNGNASKEEIRNYIIDTHPAYAVLCGVDQDEYDAVGVALYGLGVIDRAAHLTL